MDNYYLILDGQGKNAREDLQKKLSEKIAQGWEPCGGVVGWGFGFIQAVWKRPPPKA